MTPVHGFSHTFLYVRDQDEALEFYTGPVGLKLTTDADLGVMRWLTVSPPEQLGIEIVLMAIGPPVPTADQAALHELMMNGSLPAIIFATSDCDATFHRLVEAGARPTQDPKDQPYGVRDCAFHDPSGNSIRFSQPLQSG